MSSPQVLQALDNNNNNMECQLNFKVSRALEAFQFTMKIAWNSMTYIERKDLPSLQQV